MHSTNNQALLALLLAELRYQNSNVKIICGHKKSETKMDDMVTSREEMLNSDNFCASYPELPVLNLTDPAVASRYEYKPFPAALVAAIYPGFALLGLTTNLVFLLTVYRVKSMRTRTNAYLSNLAISDVMFLSTGRFMYINIVVIFVEIKGTGHIWFCQRQVF